MLELKPESSRFFADLFDAEISCAFSRRRQGNMSLNYGDSRDALKNREVFLNDLSIDSRNLVCAKQAHGCRVKVVNQEDRGKGALAYESALADTDSLVTNERRLPLAIFTADCLSLFLFDRQNKVVGLVHAGWKGTKDGIAAKTLEIMKNAFKAEPQDISAYLGPAIRSCCYEVGPEFKQNFTEGLSEREGHLFLDLAALNKKQLLDSGVSAENISDCGICTSCQNKDYFSFRKEGASSGRMMSVIMLK
jgi:hypothetical protein